MDILSAKSDAAIRACFGAFSELRPHLTENAFVSQAKRQMQNHGYALVYILDQEQVVAAAGYRVAEFLAWGKTLYVDDLVTAAPRGKEAMAAGCLTGCWRKPSGWAASSFTSTRAPIVTMPTGYTWDGSSR